MSEDGSEMTIEEALFEYAAAFADMEELAEGDLEWGSLELVNQVREAYDLDVADEVLDREDIVRDRGFDPYSIRKQNNE